MFNHAKGIFVRYYTLWRWDISRISSWDMSHINLSWASKISALIMDWPSFAIRSLFACPESERQVAQNKKKSPPCPPSASVLRANSHRAAGSRLSVQYYKVSLHWSLSKHGKTQSNTFAGLELSHPLYSCDLSFLKWGALTTNVIYNIADSFWIWYPAQLRRAHYLAARLKAENFKSGWNDHSLLLVVRRGHSLKGLEPLEGGFAALGLVGHHATDGSPEDFAGGAEVEGPAGGVDIATLSQELKEEEGLLVLIQAGAFKGLPKRARMSVWLKVNFTTFVQSR